MRKLALFAVLIGWVGAGCGGTEPEAEQQNAAMETGGQLATVESALSVCGIGCPDGYHAESYYCNTSCGLCTNTCSQASNCQPNDDSFDTCGACPPGYRSTSAWCNPMCIVCGASCFGLTNSNHCVRI